MKKFNMDDVKVNIIHTGNLTHEQQLEKVKKINEAFVDIAVKFHVDRIKARARGEEVEELPYPPKS